MKYKEFLWQEKNKENIGLLNDVTLTNVTKRVLENKGLIKKEIVDKFLHPTLSKLYDPFLLNGMDKVTSRIAEAIKSKEKICIYGDYDVDGITSISIFLKYFQKINYEAIFYIPDREKEGYGINSLALENIKNKGVSLVISVDCGITSVKEADFAKTIGLDLIITDHHNPQEEIPNSYEVINPKRTDCSYPFDMLCGAGIVFKIVQALLKDEFNLFVNEIIDLAAFGTVSDIAPLVDENRIITKVGLDVLNNTSNIGLKELIDISELTNKKINAGHIGFILAPKINASGRIGNPRLAVELLTTNSKKRAKEIARELTQLNKERQNREKLIVEEALKYIDENLDPINEKILVVKGENWHTGIVGIVSSKISEKYYKPSIILNEENGILKGSARSVGDFDLFSALDSVKELFLKFGGHKQAAGLSMESINYEKLRIGVNNFADLEMKETDIIPKIKYDMSLLSKDINYKVLDELELLEPFGMGNSKPIFIYNNLNIDQFKCIGKEKNHLKITVHDEKRVYDSLGFSMAEKAELLRTNQSVNLAFSMERNNFRGVETIQFILKDIKMNEKLEFSKSDYFFNEYIIKIINTLEDTDFTELEEYIVNIFNKKLVSISEFLFFARNLLPNRDQIAIVYRFAIKNGKISLIKNKFSGILPYQVKIALYILKMNNLIIYDITDNEYYCEKTINNKKIDITASASYKSVQNYSFAVIDILKKNKYI
ncbi:single-stranded-DNA-specific exonuclease RecJ [Helicovermis profundi]|uniref:Single-stranded-DNA-specific exonuclease RecJ n=1 Tax=Helicovermis profundi TaxID=3065157 RepID=A0AAU9EVK1_9FIRM|nr:single-stranded-DNA-specific exonuclease RecJ [Clostridia bacterium S502]